MTEAGERDSVQDQLCARIEELEKEKLELNEQLDALQIERDAAPPPPEWQSAPYVAALVDALEQIERWDGFPSTDKTWEGSGEPVSYGAAFGSNGERDFMREVARKALAAAPKPETQP